MISTTLLKIFITAWFSVLKLYKETTPSQVMSYNYFKVWGVTGAMKISYYNRCVLVDLDAEFPIFISMLIQISLFIMTKYSVWDLIFFINLANW